MKTAISAIVTSIFILLFISCGSVNDLANQFNQQASSDKSISIISPVTNDFVADIVNVQASLDGVTLDELKKVELMIGGSLKATYSLPPFNYTWDTTSLTDGPVEIKFVATLKDNTTVEKAVTVTVRKGIFVSATGSELNPGTKALPMLNIQDAVNKAVSLGISMIYVAQGNYTPGHGLNLSGSGVLITNDNIHLVGGYLSDFSARTSALSDLNGNNSLYHIFDCQWIKNLTIDGFIVRGGNANSSGWNNSAGGMMIYGITNLLVTNVIVMNNYATYVGGIEVYDGSNCSLDMIISNNVNANSCGGAMFIVIRDLNFRGKVVNNSSSPGYNGGFYVGSCTNVTVTADVKNNYCASYGGGVYIDVSLNVSLINCNVNDNVAGNHGGGLYLSSTGDFNISNCSFSRNYSGAQGGGIYMTSVDKSSILLCMINSNTIAGAGGGVSMLNSSSVTINDSSICSNSSAAGGGGMYTYSSTYSLANDIISTNRNNSSVGGMYIHLCTATITNCQINGNSTPGIAGGLYIYTSTVDFLGCSVSSNKSGSHGGGINSDGGSTLRIEGSSISYNSNSGGNGGGIYSTGSSTLSIVGSGICNNTVAIISCYGGGIYLHSGQIGISNSQFSNNYGGYGGAVSVDAAPYSLINNHLVNNSANYYGGAINIYMGSGAISGNTIDSNNTSWHGAGIFLASTTYSMNSNSIQFNCATNYYGGGIYIMSSSGNISGNTINNNISDYGGGLFLISCNSSYLNNNSICSNYAKTGTGGVHINSSSGIKLENNVITNNANPNNYLNVIMINGVCPNLVLSNNTIGGTLGSNNYAIYEAAGDTTGQVFVNNIFLTNTIQSLYYDYGGAHDIPVVDWININDTTYTGAAITSGNTVAAQ